MKWTTDAYSVCSGSDSEESMSQLKVEYCLGSASLPGNSSDDQLGVEGIPKHYTINKVMVCLSMKI